MKNQEKDINEIDDQLLSKKILDFLILNEIEESNRWIEIIDKKIKFYELKKKYTLDNKLYWFQKKALDKWHNEIDLIDNKIIEYYKEIEKELTIIRKLQK